MTIFAAQKRDIVMGMTCNLLRVSIKELEAYKSESSLLAERVDSGTDDPCLYDIDKAWDGIIYLLTGRTSSDTNSPLARIIFSGQLIDRTQSMGSGPAHYLTPEEVHQIHDAISAVGPNELRARFNPAEMKEIGVYPNAWDHPEALDYLIEYFETVQDVFAQAQKWGEAVITFIR